MSFVETVAGVVTASVLSIGLYYQWKDRQGIIRLYQSDERTSAPGIGESRLTIKVFSTKTIERCRLTFAGRDIFTDYTNGPFKKEIRLVQESGANFRVPEAIPNSRDTEVVVWDGKKRKHKELLGVIQSL